MDFDLKKQAQFRALLKKGIGSRTQKEFAKAVNIAQATLSHMLNDEIISRPKISTLEAFAANMTNVSLSDLLSACGYDEPDIETKVRNFENAIDDFFGFGDKFFLSDSIDDLLKKCLDFCRLCDHFHITGHTCSDVTEEEKIPQEIREKGAENMAEVTINWDYADHVCKTTFNIYFAYTGKKRVLFIDFAPAEELSSDNKIYMTRFQKRASSAEKRLLKAIFGEVDYDTELFPYMIAGYGFEYNNPDPEVFVDFLHRHASTFCSNKEHAKLYQRIVDGESPEDVFIKDHTVETVFECNSLGDVIAYIMSEESGLDYHFFHADPQLGEEQQISHIMIHMSSEIIEHKEVHFKREQIPTYMYAKELNIPKFGIMYHHMAVKKRTDCIHDTETMYLL